MSNSPLVSIIIPTFNREELLRECLNSIQNQQYQNWECIIVDDGSVNPYLELLKDEFGRNDKRFSFYFRPKEYPSGASACRNFGFLKSTGKYIQWLDDDDLISIDKIIDQVNRLEEFGSDFAISVCSWDLYWPGKKLEKRNSFEHTSELDPSMFFEIIGQKKTFVPCSAYLTPVNLIRKAGLWDTRLNLNDDAEFFSRVIAESKILLNRFEGYVLYRAHSGKRISEQYTDAHIESLLLSLNLMQAHLKFKGFNCDQFFKWKLLKILFDQGKKHSVILKKYSFLFKQFNLSLPLKKIYVWRYLIYKKVYPYYKRFKKN